MAQGPDDRRRADGATREEKLRQDGAGRGYADRSMTTGRERAGQEPDRRKGRSYETK